MVARRGPLRGLGEEKGMLGLKGEPLGSVDSVGHPRAMIEFRVRRHVGNEERHAIVVEGRSKLPHGAVDGVEEMVCMVYDGSRACRR